MVLISPMEALMPEVRSAKRRTDAHAQLCAHTQTGTRKTQPPSHPSTRHRRTANTQASTQRKYMRTHISLHTQRVWPQTWPYAHHWGIRLIRRKPNGAKCGTSRALPRCESERPRGKLWHSEGPIRSG